MVNISFRPFCRQLPHIQAQLAAVFDLDQSLLAGVEGGQAMSEAGKARGLRYQATPNGGQS
jgi:hypothetical protein